MPKPESRQPFTPGDSLHLRKALVTARRVELGHAKTARHHKDDAALALATRQAEIYSGLISKIDALTLSTEATRRLDDDEKGLRTVQTPGAHS